MYKLFVIVDNVLVVLLRHAHGARGVKSEEMSESKVAELLCHV